MLLREKDRQEVIKLVNESISHPVKLLAFGSRVNGDAHNTSELDLVLIAENKKIDIEDFMKLKENFKKSNIPIFVQLLDWHRIPKSFHENILKNYEEMR